MKETTTILLAGGVFIGTLAFCTKHGPTWTLIHTIIGMRTTVVLLGRIAGEAFQEFKERFRGEFEDQRQRMLNIPLIEERAS